MPSSKAEPTCRQALTAEQQEKLAQAIAANSSRKERAEAKERHSQLSMSTDCPLRLRQVGHQTAVMCTLAHWLIADVAGCHPGFEFCQWTCRPCLACQSASAHVADSAHASWHAAVSQLRGYNGPLGSGAPCYSSSGARVNPRPLDIARETVERIQTLGTVSAFRFW